MNDYQIQVTGSRRMYRWTVTHPDGTTHTNGRSYKADWVAHRDAQAYITSLNPTSAPEPTSVVTPDPAPSGWSYASGHRRGGRVHREMELLTGVPSTAARRGVCHYCGQPVGSDGYCDECR